MLDSMNSQLVTFNCFPQLPREIRLQIWEFALPDPRFIELVPRNIKYPDTPIWWTRWSGSKWVWTTVNPPPVLLNVSHEARNICLQSYESTSVWYQSQGPLRKTYVDYAKDTFYCSVESFNALQDSLIGRISSLQVAPINLASVRALSIEIRQAHPWSGLPGIQHDLGGKEISADYLASLFELFPALEELLLVIDGRNPRFDGPAELVEPTEAYKDYYEENGREMMMERIVKLVEEVKSAKTYLKIPLIRLNLFINGRDTPCLEHRWRYRYGLCRFGSPSSKEPLT